MENSRRREGRDLKSLLMPAREAGMSSSFEIPAWPRNGRCRHDKRNKRGVICRADPREFSAATTALALMAKVSAAVHADDGGSFVAYGNGRPQ
jgi:hypothetical protein